MSLKSISQATVFGGAQGVYRHQATSVNCEMEFSVFVPPQADSQPVSEKFPVVWYLSGLTCTQDNATTKAGFQRVAAELGLIIVCPDTSPRGDGVADDPDGAYDFGLGAGFYVNATQQPYAENYQMADYITQELPALIHQHFPTDPTKQAIMGHSMGGHGALSLWLKNQDIYQSVSAFAPITAPMDCPWGQKAFTGYLGTDKDDWADYDSCKLLEKIGAKDGVTILIDQGLDDNFLEGQLMPEKFESACAKTGQALTLRRQAGYDHSYYFIATFMEDHLRHHAAAFGLITK